MDVGQEGKVPKSVRSESRRGFCGEGPQELWGRAAIKLLNGVAVVVDPSKRGRPGLFFPQDPCDPVSSRDCRVILDVVFLSDALILYR